MWGMQKFLWIILSFEVPKVTFGKEKLKVTIEKRTIGQDPPWHDIALTLLEEHPSIVACHSPMSYEAEILVRKLHSYSQESLVVVMVNDDDNRIQKDERYGDREYEINHNLDDTNTHEGAGRLEVTKGNSYNKEENNVTSNDVDVVDDDDDDDDSEVILEETELYQALAVIIILHGNHPSHEIRSVLEALSKIASWSTRAKHLIILPNSGGSTEQEVKVRKQFHEVNDKSEYIRTMAMESPEVKRKEDTDEIILDVFVELWSRQVATSAVLTSTRDIWWWSAWKDGGLCEGPTRNRLIHHRMSLYDENLLFPFKSLRTPDLGGCNLTVAADVWPPYTIETVNSSTGDNVTSIIDGLEVRLVQTLSEFLNFQLSFYPTDNSEWFSPTTFTLDNKANFSIGAISAEERFYIKMDPTVTYWKENGLWFVPYRSPVPRWRNLFLGFKVELWGSVSLSVIIIAFALYVVRKLLRRKKEDINTDFVCASPDIFVLFLALLGGAVHRRPFGSVSRIVFMVWSIGCIVINSVYQSALFSVLAYPVYHSQYSTVEELLNANFFFGLQPDWREWFEIFDDPIVHGIINRSVECVDVLPCLERTAFDRDFAVPVEPSYVDFFIHTWKRSKLIETFGEEFGVYSIALYMSKHTPLLEAFNFHIERLIEGGYLSHWWNELLWNSRNVFPYADPPMAISIFHLQSAFFLLGLGHVLASVVFAVEIVTFTSNASHMCFGSSHKKTILQRRYVLVRRRRFSFLKRFSTPVLSLRINEIPQNIRMLSSNTTVYR